MEGISRRQFVRWMLGGIAGSVLTSCAPGVTGLVTPLPEVPTPTAGIPTPTMPPADTVTPTRPARAILRNENRPGFFVRYYKPFEAVDPAQWSLSVEGLVKRPQKLSLLDVQSLPRVSQVSRMKCVECWSAAARWEGFHPRALLQLVEPQSEAKWVHFYCADDYYESLTLDTLLMERVLFVHRMNDQMLPDEYGAPLRLIVPHKYGYKGPKAITRLVFAEEELPGYWPTVGPYSTDGTIKAGTDYPLDIGVTRLMGGGEIRYPDGIESKGQ